MAKKSDAEALIKAHLAAYPEMQPQDAVKLLYQAAFGGGHLVEDEEKSLSRLNQELWSCPAREGPLLEDLGGAFCRIHLSAVRKSGLSAETINRLFLLSSREQGGGEREFRARLDELIALCRAGSLPFSPDALAVLGQDLAQQGYPPPSHSPRYRAAYCPAYRVLSRRYAALVELCRRIDLARARKDRVVVAIEGGAATGKTTLVQWLGEIYPARIIHVDDFFLQPHQRTLERLAEPGGNMDRERFAAQVIAALPGDIHFQRYDCKTAILGPLITLPTKPLTVIEGVYSMHPGLGYTPDIGVFLRADEDRRRARILARPQAERFFGEWMPMEDRYFVHYDIPGRCDLEIMLDG